MATRTAFSSLYARVQRRVGDTTPTTLTKIKEAINDVAREIWYSKNWSWRLDTANAITLTASTGLYTLAIDSESLVNLYYSSDPGGKLEFKELEIFRSVHPYATAEGTPSEFTVVEESSSKTQIQLWKVPDSTFVSDNASLYYDYLKDYTDMSGDSSTGLPIQFDQMIVERAAQNILDDLGKSDPNLMAAREQKFQRRLSVAADNDRPAKGGFPMMGVDPYLQHKRYNRKGYR